MRRMAIMNATAVEADEARGARESGRHSNHAADCKDNRGHAGTQCSNGLWIPHKTTVMTRRRMRRPAPGPEKAWMRPQEVFKNPPRAVPDGETASNVGIGSGTGGLHLPHARCHPRRTRWRYAAV